MMTLIPWPDRMTSPGGCKISIEPFARNDLVLRFFDFKREKQKISTHIPALLTHWKATTNWRAALKIPLMATKFCATFSVS